MAAANSSLFTLHSSLPPIDLVVPMVFPDDPAWQQKYARYHGNDATRHVRFRSWGTEELLVRCIMKYMPWLRYIHILLDSESQMGSLPLTPPKGKGTPEIKIVFHRDFIPAEHLPCFSSPCIEMFLHRIPDLAEHFIYINDDMFPLSPLKAEDFFRPVDRIGGNTDSQLSTLNSQLLLPCQVVGEKPYPASPNTFHRACMDGLNMVAAPFGKKWTKTYLKNGHSFAPLLKSSCEEVWRRHGEQILEHLSPLSRKPDSYNQYLYVYYQYLAGLYVEHTPRLQYVGGSTSVERMKEIIRDPQAGIVCLNDNEGIQDWEKRAAVVRREIEEKVSGQRLAVSENNSSLFTLHSSLPELQVLIVHYNTPELTEAAIRSLWKHTPNAHVTVFDNSDKRPFKNVNVNVNDNRLSIIDNTKGQIVDWEKWLATFPDKIPTPENRWGSAKHCYSVEMCMDRFPDGFILMDSDVLIKKDVSQLMDRTVPWKGGVHVNTRRFGVDIPRVMPFLCWINTPMLRQHGIRYFNPQKMWNLVSSFPDRHYDTGAWLLEACNNAGLQGRRVEIKTWLEHYGHGSWRESKSPEAWLRMYRNLWYDESTKPSVVSCVKYTVLTYIFGGYERIHEVKVKDPNAEYILVTDDPSLRSDTWAIVVDEMPGLNTIEKMYQVRFHPFRYAKTELCVRLDGSIGINLPLSPIINKMEEGRCDRCLMIHPRRNKLPNEYAQWVRSRNYPQEQADRILTYMRQSGYDMKYRGLFQSCFEVVRNNNLNADINNRTFQLLRDFAPDGRMERINQTLLSFVINHYFSDRICVLPVTESIVTDRWLMTWYQHNSMLINSSRCKLAPMMFNKPCEVWKPCP